MLDPFKMVNLEAMISYSIAQCKDPEQRKRMANNVLIIGGTCQLSKFIDELEDRLIEGINVYCPNIERVEVIDPLTKKVLPAYISWVGATVIPRLDSVKDLWLTRNRWMGSCLEEQEYLLGEI